MHTRSHAICLLTTVLLLLFAACGNDTTAVPATATLTPVTQQPAQETPAQQPPETATPQPQTAESFETRVFAVASLEDITSAMLEAVPAFPKTLTFDVSELLAAEPDVVLSDTLYNAYYDLMYQYPELKYAYNMAPSYEEGATTATCQFRYMPYFTGEIDQMQLPDDTVTINTLTDLIEAAQNAIGAEQVPIAIMNKALTVDDMNKALDQAGYGYIFNQLSDDGMAITARPNIGFTMDFCVERIAELKTLAADIMDEITTPDMTDDEKLAVAYRYITANVVYDQRYFTDVSTMPKESRLAYGALVDNTAICGGFSWGFNMLCEAA